MILTLELEWKKVTFALSDCKIDVNRARRVREMLTFMSETRCLAGAESTARPWGPAHRPDPAHLRTTSIFRPIRLGTRLLWRGHTRLAL